jgi:hypothetical protein
VNGQPIETVAVPTGTLRFILARCREGIAPLVHWSESQSDMARAAMTKRKEALQSIEEEIEALIPPETP